MLQNNEGVTAAFVIGFGLGFLCGLFFRNVVDFFRKGLPVLLTAFVTVLAIYGAYVALM